MLSFSKKESEGAANYRNALLFQEKSAETSPPVEKFFRLKVINTFWRTIIFQTWLSAAEDAFNFYAFNQNEN